MCLHVMHPVQAQVAPVTVPPPSERAAFPRVHIQSWEVDERLIQKYPNTAAKGGVEAVKNAAKLNSSSFGAARGHVGELAAAKIYATDEMGSFRPVMDPRAPQNDLWSVKLGQGVQAKVHGSIDSYKKSMIKDHLAELFAVPDDHVAPVRELWRAEAERALAAGKPKEAAEALRQMNRVVPIGRPISWMESRLAVESASKAAVSGAKGGGTAGQLSKAVLRHGSGMVTVVAGGAIVGSAEACIALVQYAAGEIDSGQLNEALVRSGAQFATGSAVSAMVLFATPAAPAVLVIGIGVATAIAVNAVIDEFFDSRGLSPATLEALNRPIPPLDIDAVLGGQDSGSALIRKPGNVSLEELLTPRNGAPAMPLR